MSKQPYTNIVIIYIHRCQHMYIAHMCITLIKYCALLSFPLFISIRKKAGNKNTRKAMKKKIQFAIAAQGSLRLADENKI